VIGYFSATAGFLFIDIAKMWNKIFSLLAWRTIRHAYRSAQWWHVNGACHGKVSLTSDPRNNSRLV